MNTRGAIEGGSLQTLFIILVIIAFTGAAAFTFLNGVATNYDKSFVNESDFRYYQESFGAVNESIHTIKDTLDSEDKDLVDIVTSFFTDATRAVYNAIIALPQVFSGVINSALTVLGVPASLYGYVYALILIIVLFSFVSFMKGVRT